MPLTGPAYLVSHGGAAFPDVEFVLQGEGVRSSWTGDRTSRKGSRTRALKRCPTRRSARSKRTLPEGPHSALTANGNLCATAKTVSVRKRVTVRVHGRTKHITKTVKETVAQPLTMPTTITGQNGAVLRQTTKISVTGCSKAKKKAKKKGKRK